MITTLAGTSFNRVEFPIVKGDAVTVRRERDNPYDNDSSPAYAVMIEGARIGYIPREEPLKQKQIDAHKAGDKEAFERWKHACDPYS